MSPVMAGTDEVGVDRIREELRAWRLTRGRALHMGYSDREANILADSACGLLEDGESPESCAMRVVPGPKDGDS